MIEKYLSTFITTVATLYS